MESGKFFKGYGKVDAIRDDQALHQQSRRKRCRVIIAVAISAILLLTLIIGLILAALIHESNNELPDEPASVSSSSNSTESIKTVCNVTQYPTSCFSSISSLNMSTKSDPEAIFKLSLLVSVKELKNLSSYITSLNDVNSDAAVADCKGQFEDALTVLNDSIALMEAPTEEKLLTVEKAKDIETWISAAMTNGETCLEGLQETGSSLLDEVQGKMERLKEFLSNSLAIITKMQDLLVKFQMNMH